MPLKGRTNIILTTDNNFEAGDAIIVHSKDELFEELAKYDSNDIFVIGGETVYRLLYQYCDTAHVTKINYSYQADKFFPDLDKEPEWEVVADSDEKTYFDLEYYFYKYSNKSPKSIHQEI